MGQIVNLDSERVLREPHYSLTVQCVACGYVWIACLPLGSHFPNMLECPDCEREARGEPRGNPHDH